MDPNTNGVWSASEVNIVKSLIASHITNNTCTNDTNKKHIAIVDELQERFPWKEKHQVTDLYVELVMEMMTTQSNNQHVVVSTAHVNGNFGMSMGPSAMNNMDMLQGYPMDEMEAMKMVEEQPYLLNVVPNQRRQHATKFWTTNEHRSFIFFTDLETFVTSSILIFSAISKQVVFRFSYHEMLRFDFYQSLEHG